MKLKRLAVVLAVAMSAFVAICAGVYFYTQHGGAGDPQQTVCRPADEKLMNVVCLPPHEKLVGIVYRGQTPLYLTRSAYDENSYRLHDTGQRCSFDHY